MFQKVLVANRGEIAVRVQRTLREMGIATVGVYSEADRNAPHVSLADEAFPLVGVTPEETYLNAKKIMGIAKECGAEDIHPGYGFLSENPDFARACNEAGIVFIGPTAANMAALGDKARAKEMADRAGVPVVPSGPVTESFEDIERQAAQLGYPLLIKATAGGGGRGMRRVDDESELVLMAEVAAREAEAAFGDGRVFLERFVPGARHIEVQVLADGYGNAVHLMERECSIQRRRQKLIEETPSPALTPGLRERMGKAALALARQADYVNAGTVEFLFDLRTNQFFFLEMNTRLQVEHPITEETLGMDLVAWQVRIAAGEKLGFGQGDVDPRGHAIECRVYAEDPYNDFLPTGGKLAVWEPPSGPGIRLDSGVAEGDEVSPHYDALLAKLIARGPDRDSALRRMERALSEFVVLGTVTNIPFLREVVRNPRFREGEYDTGFLERARELFSPGIGQDAEAAAAAVAALELWQRSAQRGDRAGEGREPEGQGEISPWRAVGSRMLP